MWEGARYQSVITRDCEIFYTDKKSVQEKKSMEFIGAFFSMIAVSQNKLHPSQESVRGCVCLIKVTLPEFDWQRAFSRAFYTDKNPIFCEPILGVRRISLSFIEVGTNFTELSELS